MVADKLNNSNIDLPKLEGPLADVMKEENKELNQLPVVAEAKIEKVKQQQFKRFQKKVFLNLQVKNKKLIKKQKRIKKKRKLLLEKWI